MAGSAMESFVAGSPLDESGSDSPGSLRDFVVDGSSCSDRPGSSGVPATPEQSELSLSRTYDRVQAAAYKARQRLKRRRTTVVLSSPEGSDDEDGGMAGHSTCCNYSAAATISVLEDISFRLEAVDDIVRDLRRDVERLRGAIESSGGDRRGAMQVFSQESAVSSETELGVFGLDADGQS
ncbi:hypothetical protein MAPG_03545 [Magnaporthiopsis poae ATCC 64411]|uniref:Uncharacterized protein n=1 Tax=Magnaporthiopsis poae (strain ATCC 64411 / 73-15) TaxID=644358 RepID=A0A0C4DUA8_MAGP6|nr:hypothetical protein MAPG_03545 [Magnaporthiopsis poae ATCC 64411]